jgi:hypothetical protein
MLDPKHSQRSSESLAVSSPAAGDSEVRWSWMVPQRCWLCGRELMLGESLGHNELCVSCRADEYADHD